MAKGTGGICQKHYDYDLAKRPGWVSGYVPAGPVQAHILCLKESGVTFRRICEIAGIGSVTKIVSGKQKRVQAMTARRILDIAYAPGWEDDHADGVFVQAIGLARRIESLMALGYLQQDIAERVGMTRQGIRYVRERRHLIRAGTARKIEALFQELQYTPAPKVAYQCRPLDAAQEFGWVIPMYWDEDAIDDPQAAPDRPTDEKTDWYDSYLELREFGLTLERAADRLGIARDTVKTRLRRKAAA